MATYYAWSSIKAGTSEKPVNIERGAKVAQSDLGISDAEWDAIVESGAVREKEFPAPEGYPGSAIDYLRERLQEAQAMSGVEEEEAASELATAQAMGETTPAPEPEAKPTSTTKK
jgi:hypothetical protein